MKRQCVLAIYDIVGIQDFIFATNRLAENTGASGIVSKVLEELLPEAFHDYSAENKEHGVVAADWDKAVENSEFHMMTDPDMAAEIIYIGGGNALAAYRDVDTYDEISRRLAEKFVRISTVLTLVSAHILTGFDNYRDDWNKLKKELAETKTHIPRSRELSSYAIAEQEPSYGLPVAHCYCGKGMSTAQWEKLKAGQQKKSIYQLEQGMLPEGVTFAVEMDDLVTEKGKDSYVAVIHIDGNGMGQAIERLMKDSSQDYHRAVSQIRNLSRDISNLYGETYQRVIKQFYKPGKERIYPFRLILMGGDDLTIVCKAGLGLPFAAVFLRELMLQNHSPFPLTACAGIALVHSHFPMSIAYRIAESCCENAKDQWYGDQEGEHCGYLDYHLVRGAYVRNMSEVRNSQYTYGGHYMALTGRPYRVSRDKGAPGQDDFVCLDSLINRMLGVGADGENIWPRSRLKRLYEALMGRKEELEILKREYQSRGYEISELLGENQGKGVLFDALELADLYERGRWLNENRMAVN